MQDIGISVGEWSDNQYTNFGSGFSAFGGRNLSLQSDYPFYMSSLNFKTIRTSLGITWSEYSKRGKLVKKYKEQGVLLPQLNDFYRKFKVRGGGTLEQFDSFVADQRLIAQAKEREEAELLKRLKEEEEKKVISDLNLFPPKDEDTTVTKDKTTVKQTLIGEKQTDKKPNYLLFGLIGLGVIIGGFLIFKKK